MGFCFVLFLFMSTEIKPQNPFASNVNTIIAVIPNL